ncbi:MAG: hypothetical protein J6Y08_07085 [Clostridiales bacterium]|nr:hypothetical protein [Clostridiales bacterium]
MGRCVICGTQGILLKLDNQGRCENCAQQVLRKDQEEEESFNYFYAGLLRVVKEIQGPVEIDKELTKAQESIPQFQEKIDKCNSLLNDVYND